MTNEEAKVFLDNLKICINEHPIVADWLVEIENRNDEPNCSEIPNNCEHITEDGVTCAKYPACDDCLDNPLNKVKGSERLLKGKDEPQTCDTCKHNKLEWYSDVCDGCSKAHSNYEPQNHSGEVTEMVKDEPRICDTCRYYNSYIPCGSTPSACKEADKFAKEFVDGLKKLKPKVEPQTICKECVKYPCESWQKGIITDKHNLVECRSFEPKDEPQTEEGASCRQARAKKFGEMDDATFKAHCMNCQRDPADIKCLDCDGNKYFLSYGAQTDCAWK